MKKVRLYFQGFSEAAWENLQPLWERYDGPIDFETAFSHSGDSLIICVLIQIEEDPAFFNQLRNERRIAWWEYFNGSPPNTIWHSGRRGHFSNMKSD